jgi:hypothetical protein
VPEICVPFRHYQPEFPPGEHSLREFGFADAALASELFLAPKNVVRMGLPPMRLEILTSVSGVDFDTCFAERTTIDIAGVGSPDQSGSIKGEPGGSRKGQGSCRFR